MNDLCNISLEDLLKSVIVILPTISYVLQRQTCEYRGRVNTVSTGSNLPLCILAASNINNFLVYDQNVPQLDTLFGLLLARDKYHLSEECR